MAAIGTTPGGNIAVKAGVLITPEDHTATITLIERIGLHLGAGGDHGDPGIRFRPLAEKIATDQHLTAAAATAGIHPGLIQEGNAIGQQFHASTLGRGPTAGIDHTVDLEITAGGHSDRAAGIARSAGLDQAIKIDGGMQQSLGFAGANADILSLELALIEQGGADARIESHLIKTVAGQIKGGGGP